LFLASPHLNKPPLPAKGEGDTGASRKPQITDEIAAARVDDSTVPGHGGGRPSANFGEQGIFDLQRIM
jgi:hypothetical protein